MLLRLVPCANKFYKNTLEKRSVTNRTTCKTTASYITKTFPTT